jgi:AcrR family transcriptional regulator
MTQSHFDRHVNRSPPTREESMPTPSPRRPAETGNARGNATRARLLEAALEAFAERGFHGTGTRDIATAAGMSPAAVYVHYRSKEELLFALSLAGHQEAESLVVAAAGWDADPTSRLRRAMCDFTTWHARNHVTARVVQFEMAALAPEHARDVAVIRRRIEQLVADLIDDGRAAGQFAITSTEMAPRALLSLGIDVARWYRPDGAWSPEEIGERYAELGLQLVGHRG